jgi:Concanavalin A-like lectin/glucanases superfamily
MNADVGKNLRTPAPRTLPEVYAQEALFLQNEPRRELKLQAIRIGDLGIAAIPNEVFAISGLKIKAKSPFETTFSIELANGAEGYIPPPEQHSLGGYTTWPARTAGLEVQAEPQIIAAVLRLLEQVAGKPRRAVRVSDGPFGMAIKASRPVAYWRFDDIEGLTAQDASANQRHAHFEGGIALYLPGAPFSGLNPGKVINRAVHFAGGCMKAVINDAGEASSLELWFWNGLPVDVRELTGHILSLVSKQNKNGSEIKVGLTGRNHAGGRLFLACGNDKKEIVSGRTEIGLKTWHHVTLVCDRQRVSVFLDGNAEPEVSLERSVKVHGGTCELIIGGSNDGSFNFEGKIDEVALFDRALSVREIAKHYQAARPRLD